LKLYTKGDRRPSPKGHITLENRLLLNGARIANRCLASLPEYLSTKEKQMKIMFTKLVQNLRKESGQDLIEYALVVALIAFAATAGMSGVAGKINTAFSKIGTTLTTYVS
jgi:pilus assembly protein Flp/PilA